MREFKILILAIGWLCFHFSCIRHGSKHADLNEFFETLKEKVEKPDLMAFQNAPVDSADIYFGEFYDEYRKAFNEKIATDDRMMGYLNELQFDFPDYLYLVYNFHGWLNGREYSLSECNEIYQRFNKLKDFYYQKLEGEALRIVLNNLTNCKVGDTVELIFPSSAKANKLNIKEALPLLYPYSLEINPYEDTIRLHALLQEKLLDTKDIIFRLQLTKLSEERVMLLGNVYRVGDTIDLPIEIYARPLTVVHAK